MSSLSITSYALERGFLMGNQPHLPHQRRADRDTTDEVNVPPRILSASSTDSSSEKRLLASVFSCSSSVVAGFVVGYFIDASYGTSPRWTLGLGLLCTALGIYQLIKEIRR